MRTIANLIRQARADAGMTQAQLAVRADTSQPALARYEHGDVVPTLPTLERLLAACGQRLEIGARRARTARATTVRAQRGDDARELRRARPRLLAAARRHGVRRVRVFGSFARGEATAESDVDLLVDLDSARTLVDLVAFQDEAAAILKRPVDAATADMLKDRVRVDAERDAVAL